MNWARAAALGQGEAEVSEIVSEFAGDDAGVSVTRSEGNVRRRRSRNVRPRRESGGSRDRGSMTVFMLGVIAGALVLAVLVGGLVRGITARGQAQAAADLSALAAGEVSAVGGTDPCGVARRVAERNRATLTRCEVADGRMVELTTTVAVQPLPGWHESARATARAGPVGRA